MKNLLKKLSRDERGVSALEYAILAAVIVAAVATATTTLGADITTLFGKFTTAISNAAK